MIELIGVMLGSSTITGVVMILVNRKKIKAETEDLVATTYQKLVQDLRKQIDLMAKDLEDLKGRERLYLENSNLMLKAKDELKNRVRKLEERERELLTEIKRLRAELAEYKAQRGKR